MKKKHEETELHDDNDRQDQTDEALDLESRLAKAEEERDLAKDQLQRAMADLQNFRRRRAQDMEEARHGAVEVIAHELLPVLDNFHLALEAMGDSEDPEADRKALDEGVRMVQTLLSGVLERRGLREIEGQPGSDFDHQVHEAVGLLPDSEHDSGRIAKVLQRGYMLGDKVLRHTRVLVAGDEKSE